jgi:hypothetical protein
VERAIAAERRAFARATAATRTEAGVLDVADGCAVYTGHGLFSNRVLGLGLEGSVSAADLDAIELFYAERGARTEIELASVASPALITLLGRRSYRLHRFRNIFARPAALAVPPAAASTVAVEVVDPSTRQAWSRVLIEGFGYRDPQAIRRVEEWNDALLTIPGLTAVVATVDGEIAASASVVIDGGVAVLGGAATVHRHRRRGAHLALIAARVELAREAGCDLAVVTADPVSTSARNSERSGFRLVCTHGVMVRST